MPRKKTKDSHVPGKTLDKHGRVIPNDPTKDKPMVNFLTSLDPDTFRQALASQEEESRYRQLLDFMLDPAFKRYTISRLCKMVGVSLNDIMDLMRNYAIAEGTVRLMTHLPQVMDDVGQDAKSQNKACPRCDGTGLIQDPQATTSDGELETVALTRQCPECMGTKTIRQVGDKYARELVFETAKLINQKVPLVAQQFNNFGGSGLKPVLMETQNLLEPGK